MKTRHRNGARSEKGFSLVLVMLVLLVVGLMMTGMFSIAMPSVRAVTGTKRDTALRCAAESSLDYVVNRVAAADANYTVAQGEANKTVSIPSDIIGNYGGLPVTCSAVITNTPCPAGSSLYEGLLDPSYVGSSVTKNSWTTVTATATNGGRSLRLRSVMQPVLTGIPSTPTPWNLPNGGIVLQGNFTSGGGITVESYNSKTDPNGTKNTKNANIMMNGIIDTNGKSGAIYGNVQSYNKNKASNNTSLIVSPGTLSQLADPIFFPPVPAPPATAKSISPITAATDLPPGDYVIDMGPLSTPTAKTAQPAISLNGGGKNAGGLTINGPTQIWIKGQFPTVDLGGGGLVNKTGLPANFKLFYKPNNEALTQDATNITLGGNSAFKGVVYAPNTMMQMKGTSGFYGAVVANGANLQGGGNGQDGAFHFDEALAGQPLFNWVPSNQQGVQHSKVASWEELSN